MIDTIYQHYATCALWSSHNYKGIGDDENPEPFEEDFSIYDIAESSEKEAKQAIEGFLELLEENGLEWRNKWSLEQLGHDFWLTRNGHGTGFWDRGHGDLGDKLTQWAKTFSGCDPYEGDDGKVYLG